MKYKSIAVILFVLLAGGIFLMQDSTTEGVRAHSVTDLTSDLNLGSGTCAAKIDNTNSYPVNVTYKFRGIESDTTRINGSSTVPVEGIGCSEASIEILQVRDLDQDRS